MLFLFKLLTSCFFSEVRHSLLLIENTESFSEPKNVVLSHVSLKFEVYFESKIHIFTFEILE